MHKRVLGCSILCFVLFLSVSLYAGSYFEEKDSWIREPLGYALPIIIPVAFYIAYRLSIAKDEEIQTLNLKESPDERKRELDKYV